MALALLAAAASDARAAIEGPVARLAASGGRADIVARADGSALAVWESATTVRFCRIAAGAGECAAGSERDLTSAVGATRSRPFLFDLGGQRIVVVHGVCCPQRTYRWVSTDGGSVFPASGVDFASVVPVDQGAAAGPGDSISLLGEPARYQLAPLTGAKTTQEVVLDGATGLTGARAVSVDPATNRPFALWGSAADAFAAGATSAAPVLAASWTLPAAKLAGVTGMRVAGSLATWVRGGRHEVARWSGAGFTAGVPLPGTPDDAGEADIAVDPAGGQHVVFSPPGTGSVCYARAPADGAFGAPVLLGRDTAGVAGLQVAATGPGAGRAIFTTPAASGPVSVVPLASTTLVPNTCGLPPAGVRLTRAAGGAKVNVAVDPSGQDTTYRVEYGTTTAYGSSTPEVALPGGGGPVAATVALGSLKPGFVYHARVSAANATGTVTSEDLRFVVPARIARVDPARLIGFPGRCTGRRLRVGLGRPGVSVTAARVVVRGRRALRVGVRGLRAREVVLTRLPARRVRVSVKLKLADGRIVARARGYRRCAAR